MQTDTSRKTDTRTTISTKRPACGRRQHAIIQCMRLSVCVRENIVDRWSLHTQTLAMQLKGNVQLWPIWFWKFFIIINVVAAWISIAKINFIWKSIACGDIWRTFKSQIAAELLPNDCVKVSVWRLIFWWPSCTLLVRRFYLKPDNSTEINSGYSIKSKQKYWFWHI